MDTNAKNVILRLFSKEIFNATSTSFIKKNHSSVPNVTTKRKPLIHFIYISHNIIRQFYINVPTVNIIQNGELTFANM